MGCLELDSFVSYMGQEPLIKELSISCDACKTVPPDRPNHAINDLEQKASRRRKPMQCQCAQTYFDHAHVPKF